MPQRLKGKILAHNRRYNHSRDQSVKQHSSHNRLSLFQGILLQASLFGHFKLIHPILDYKGGAPHTILTITRLIDDRTIQHHTEHQLCPHRLTQPLEAIH